MEIFINLLLLNCARAPTAIKDSQIQSCFFNHFLMCCLYVQVDKNFLRVFQVYYASNVRVIDFFATITKLYRNPKLQVVLLSELSFNEIRESPISFFPVCNSSLR